MIALMIGLVHTLTIAWSKEALYHVCMLSKIRDITSYHLPFANSIIPIRRRNDLFIRSRLSIIYQGRDGQQLVENTRRRGKVIVIQNSIKHKLWNDTSKKLSSEEKS